MIPHKITLSDSDGVATLLALSFATRRVVVRWGDEVTAHVTAYRLDQDSQWRRETVPHGYRLEAIAGKAGDRLCRDIGGLWDTVSAQSAGVGLGALESWLRADGWLATRARLRAVARWLLRQRTGSLAHGRDLLDDLAFEGSIPLGGGGGEIDDLLGSLLRLGVVRLYEFAPSAREGAIFMPGDVKQARGLRKRIEGEADASAVGAKHWYFARGERWSELPEFSL